MFATVCLGFNFAYRNKMLVTKAIDLHGIMPDFVRIIQPLLIQVLCYLVHIISSLQSCPIDESKPQLSDSSWCFPDVYISD